MRRWTILACIGLAIASALPWVATGRLPSHGDISAVSLVQREFAALELAEGRFPVWYAALHCGFPTGMEGQAQVFSPFGAVTRLVVPDPFLSFGASACLHVFFFLLGFVRWLSARGLPAAPAIAGGAAFILGGPYIAESEHLGILSAFSCWPWLFLFAGRGRRGDAPSLAAVAALMLVSAGPQAAYYGLLATIALRIVEGRGMRWRYLLAALASGAAVASAYWVPLLDLVGQSHRGGPAFRPPDEYAGGADHLLAAFLPEARPYHRAHLHLGAIGLLLTAAGTLSRLQRRRGGASSARGANRLPRRFAWALAGVAALGVVLSFPSGSVVREGLDSVLPGLSKLGAPARALLLVTLAASVFAAEGARVVARGRRWPAVCAAVLVASELSVRSTRILAPLSVSRRDVEAVQADLSASGISREVRVSIPKAFGLHMVAALLDGRRVCEGWSPLPWSAFADAWPRLGLNLRFPPAPACAAAASLAIGQGGVHGRAIPESWPEAWSSGSDPAGLTASDAFDACPGPPLSAERPAHGRIVVRLDAPSREPGWIAVAETAMPGWTAEVATEGGRTRPADPGRWLGVFLSVRIPRGTSEVRLRFAPRSVPFGMAASALAAALLLAAFLRPRP